jgi:hypothetical protein
VDHLLTIEVHAGLWGLLRQVNGPHRPNGAGGVRRSCCTLPLHRIDGKSIATRATRLTY